MSATGRSTVRTEQDFYPTPAKSVVRIIDRIKLYLISSSREPCKGTGVIYDLLPGKVDYAELSEGLDYLTLDLPTVDLIVTNPPFSLALEFLTKSLLEADTVIYLLRLNFLGSKKRKEFWKSNRPSHLYVLSERPSFTGHGTDATEYAWFAWDRGRVMEDEPGIYVV